jgi:chromosome partitioning protein
MVGVVEIAAPPGNSQANALPRAEPRPPLDGPGVRRVVFNQKGGVGKTTISVNLAACAARAGKRVLLIDSDPNGNATANLLGREQAPGRTLADFYEGCLGLSLFRQSLAEHLTMSTSVPGLQLVASDRRLDDLRTKLESRHKINKLRDGLEGLYYDEIYFDTPPTLDFYTLSCLIAAHEVIIPIDCDAFSIEAAKEVRRAVGEIRQDHNPPLAIAGVVVNQFQRSTLHSSRMVSELRDLGFRVLEPFIPTSVAVRESHSGKRPLVVGRPEHAVAGAFVRLAQALGTPRA